MSTEFVLRLRGSSEGYRCEVESRAVGLVRGEEPVPPEVLKQLVLEEVFFGDTGTLSAAREHGRDLYETVFSEPIRKSIKAALRETGDLRLSVRLDDDPELHRLPWELCHDGDYFLALHPRIAFHRHLEVARGQSTVRVDGPIQVLLTTSQPGDDEALDLRSEFAAMNEQVARVAKSTAGAHLRIRVEPKASARAVRRALRRAEFTGQPFHVWHHCGHGLDGKDDFELLLEEDGEPRQAGAEDLSGIVADAPSLRLLVLNTCHGGEPGALASYAAGLGVPAAIGHRGRIPDRQAIRFAEAFHEKLYVAPLDVAVRHARLRLLSTGDQTAWASPVLFARSLDDGLSSRSSASPEKAGVPTSGKGQGRG